MESLNSFQIIDLLIFLIANCEKKIFPELVYVKNRAVYLGISKSGQPFFSTIIAFFFVKEPLFLSDGAEYI